MRNIDDKVDWKLAGKVRDKEGEKVDWKLAWKVCVNVHWKVRVNRVINDQLKEKVK